MKVALPKFHLEPDVLSNVNKAIQMEWLVTNGLGGYASSTILGVNTRKYHGLLIAAFNPPTDRRVLLSKMDEEVQVGNKSHPIGSNEFKNGIQPEGYRFLSGFSLNPFPTYKYAVEGVQLQKTIFMPYGKNATAVSYDIFNPHNDKVSVRIFPLINCRHFHSVINKDKLDWEFIQKFFEQGVIIHPSVPLSTIILSSGDGQNFVEKREWIERMFFRVDDARGDSCQDDVFQPGWFEFNVAPEEKKKFFVVATAGKTDDEAKNVLSSICMDIDALRDQELNWRKGLFAKFQEQYIDIKIEDWLKWLILATDSFIVNRKSTKTRSMIAGYPWFEDWGRDSLISLPGLTLVTGRFDDAKQILLTFKRYYRRGNIPNRFPDYTGENPDYNTVDATLWYFNAVLQYLKYTGDHDFVRKQLWSLLMSIIQYHRQGTMHHIRLGDDGLIEHGPQLTWMDAMVNNEFVTPRNGKAVEIQALWYNALRTMEMLATRFNQKEQAEEYSVMAEKTRKSFLEKFWNPQMGCLFDVIHGEHRDASLRPNQVIAVALDFFMLDKTMSEKIVETVWKKLFVTYGLKTLSDDNSQYIGKYLGDWNHRNKAYHNGTVWAWLLGPFITAFLKLKNHEKHWRVFALNTFLQPLFEKEIFQAGLGTISEVFDGNPPHTPRGCIAQAWSVAEPLRAFMEDVMLKRPPYERKILGGSSV
ncbi:MAG: glycogen debranching enzyme family protein [Candidatus Bathyarchaeota archaeon]|nr:MAG: glycogen debranching enzyme family protein [Candidatus Bathyarchaeota archaeon]